MTDRMRDEQLDREIRGFLAWQAEDITDAPTATEMAMQISSRAGLATAGVAPGAPQLVWVVLAGSVDRGSGRRRGRRDEFAAERSVAAQPFLRGRVPASW